MKSTLRTLLLASALTSVACGGCGDEPDDKANNTDPTPDTGMTEEDMTVPDMGPIDEPDLPPMVDRDIPGGLLLRMTPGRDTYPPGIRLLPEVEIFDVWGDPRDYDWEMTVEPAGAATQVEDRWEILEEGIVRFTACTTKLGVDDQPVCGWDEVVVDVAPPTIEITSPLPGEMLDATAHPVIAVTGTITDSFGEITAFINGEPIELDADGNFTADIEPRFGVNTIEVAASDGLDPRTSEAVIDVLWATDYTPATDPPVDYADALELRLGQLFMDDRVRPMTNPDGTTVTSDLADIMSLVINNFDLSSQIPDPVIDQSGFFLRVPSIVLGKPSVQIDLVDGGLEIFVQIPDLLANTEGSFTFNNTVLDLNGTLTAGMSALIAISVDKSSPTAPIQVSVDSISVAVERATPNFASAEANAIFALASSVLRTTLEELLLDTLEGSFVDEIPTLLADVFVALEDVLANQSVDLDTGLGAPITLDIDGGVQTIEAVFRDNLTAVLGLTARTTVTDTWPDTRGTALLYPPGPPSFFQQSRVQFGLRFAMVNSLLHALWQAGLLEADVTDVVPVNVDRAELSARLPPVVRPPLEGEPHDFVIELGQVEIETEILGRTDRYGVHISTGVDFGLDQGAIAVDIGSMPQIRTWLISSSEDQPFLTPDALRDLIRNQVWPEFTAAFAGGLSIPLPAPDLSGLGSVAAPLGNLTLEYKELRPLAIRDGWIVIDANLQGTLPP